MKFQHNWSILQNASGTVNAFSATVKDDNGVESILPVQVPVMILAAQNPASATITSSSADTNSKQEGLLLDENSAVELTQIGVLNLENFTV